MKKQPICIPYDRQGNRVQPGDPNACSWVINHDAIKQHRGRCGITAELEEVTYIESETLSKPWVPLFIDSGIN